MVFSRGNSTATSTRSNDSFPWKGGGELRFDYRQVGSGVVFSLCSSGAPLLIGTSRYLLTAGHCRSSGSYVNGATTVGYMNTTAWPGNADIYTDFTLINTRGAMVLFNGVPDTPSDPGPATTLPIGGGYYGVLPQNFQLCSSGRTTGQICRYIVESSNQTETYDGVEIGHMTVLSHLGDGDLGWVGGDSGGPVYYNSNGRMIIAGIVGGRYTNYLGADNWYVAQMSGVRAWSPSAVISS